MAFSLINARLKFSLASTLLFALAVASLAHADKKSSLFINDKGKFKVLVDNNPLGQEEFEIFSTGGNWVAKATTHLTAPGGPAATVTGNLILQPDGAPVSYEWTSQAAKNNSAHIQFTNSVARMTVQLGSAHSFQQDLTFTTPLIVVLDDNLYYQYAVLARVYDWSRRGTQNFSVLVPQELLPGTITVDWAGSLSAEGKTYEGLKVTTNDLQVILYLDGNHRLMRLEVPSSKAVVVRE